MICLLGFSLRTPEITGEVDIPFGSNAGVALQISEQIAEPLLNICSIL